ncbi:MAG: hypothetical protein JXN59_11360 [Anaerolineae bacterium]|nr:hypothetical protein [Anaerolineae bacterium]
MAARTEPIIRQREWPAAELRAAGFRYYSRQKALVMARALPEAEAPLRIEAAWGALIARAGDMICYRPAEAAALPGLADYDHWPVRRDIFEQDYAAWDGPPLPDSPALRQLRAAGCQPYYKRAGCWARLLQEPTRVQSLESPEPVRYPPGMWLCIGSQGEPWVQTDAEFRARYLVED